MDPAMNFAKSSVSQGYLLSATTIALDSNDANLAQWSDPASVGAYNAVWWDATNYADPADDPNREIVRVTAKNSNNLTITRAQESTTATDKNSTGSTYKLAVAPTAKLVSDITSAMIDAGSVYGWVTDAPYDAAGNGTTDDYASFAAAVAALTHIVVPAGTYKLSTNLTIGATITLELLQGAVLAPDNTKTLTLNCNIIAGNWDWQGGSGTIDISGARNMASAAPAAGTWKLGDIVWNSEPAATEYVGWVCVSAGTPGTWKGFGAIEA